MRVFWLSLISLFFSVASAHPIGAAVHDSGQRKQLGELTTPAAEVSEEEDGVLLLKFSAWPASGTIRFPRLNNPVRTVFLAADPERKTLQFSPEVDHWNLRLSEQHTRFAPVLSMALVGPLRLHEGAPPVRSDTPDRIVIPAHAAVVHGKNLRYEPQPHKNTVGYWSRVEDWVEWSVIIPASGRFDVELRQGCGKGHGGSKIVVSIGKHHFPFTVIDTGGFQTWRDVSLGQIDIRESGEQRVTIQAKTKAGGAVMDVQRIVLKRVRTP